MSYGSYSYGSNNIGGRTISKFIYRVISSIVHRAFADRVIKQGSLWEISQRIKNRIEKLK